jgi:hypothetical protein
MSELNRTGRAAAIAPRQDTLVRKALLSFQRWGVVGGEEPRFECSFPSSPQKENSRVENLDSAERLFYDRPLYVFFRAHFYLESQDEAYYLQWLS